MPEILLALIETVDEAGPFGAKGLGEAGTIPISAAVANAVKDATGVRVTTLPLTPERVYRAIRAAKNDHRLTGATGSRTGDGP
jgi:xanthine dehydrogenase molybdenum-binding subunit